MTQSSSLEQETETSVRQIQTTIVQRILLLNNVSKAERSVANQGQFGMMVSDISWHSTV